MNELFSQGGKGSTGILTNKQAVARHFGVKQSEVVYFSVGALLTGYKVIYDKATQRAYSLPADIGSGVTAVSLSPAGVLVHSAGNVDLGALAVAREEYVTLPGSFDTGVTVNTKNELVVYTAGKYRWDGALPKEVPAGSTPDSTGEVKLGAWISVGDASLRSNLYSTDDTKGDALIGVKLPVNGAVNRTQHDKNQDSITPQDFGVKMDGTDSTVAIDSFVAYVNSIPNPDGTMVGVVFGPGNITYNNTMHFTRPVHLFCEGTVFNYTGSGDAIQLGPDDLNGDYNGATGKVTRHKQYAITGATFEGGTTAGNAIFFANWVPDCRVIGCTFKAFGGTGSWAVRADYNNWLVTVADCIFWGHTDFRTDEDNVRNFVSTRGYMLDETNRKIEDLWSTRLHGLNNRLFGVGWRHAGTGYLVSGWKSRIVGGSSEGLLDDVVISGGCNDVEINGFYVEKGFSGTTSVPCIIKFSYPDDPYVLPGFADGGAGFVPTTATTYISRLNIQDCYFNLHNNEHDARVSDFNSNIQLKDLSFHNNTLVHSYHSMFPAPEILGHTNWSIKGIRYDGAPELISHLIDGPYSSFYKPSFISKVKNLLTNPTASAIQTGFSGAAPVSTNFGTSGLTASSNGTGGYIELSKRTTLNTIESGYERNRLSMQNSVYMAKCTAVANGLTYLQLQWDTSISPAEIQGTEVTLSFTARAYTSAVALNGFIVNGISGENTQSVNTVNVLADGNWYRYSLNFQVQQLPLGAGTTDTEVVRAAITFPTGLFNLEFGEPVLNIGGIAYPLAACY